MMPTFADTKAREYFELFHGSRPQTREALESTLRDVEAQAVKHDWRYRILIMVITAIRAAWSTDCEDCDCADPTAAAGLASDCDCACHRRKEI